VSKIIIFMTVWRNVYVLDLLMLTPLYCVGWRYRDSWSVILYTMYCSTRL